MSNPHLHRFARQSLVPLLGFIAMSLFVINFFTFLSHQFDPSRCTADVQPTRVEHRVIELPGVHARAIEIEMREVERELRQAEAELRRAERALRCDRMKARVAEAREQMAARLAEAREQARTTATVEVRAPRVILQ